VLKKHNKHLQSGEEMKRNICIVQAMNLYFRIPADVMEAAVRVGVEYGDSDVWHYVHMRYKQSVLPSEKQLYLDALTETRNMWLIRR
jgi:hypothetical protein